ncbi:uncharacterized protein LY89DRAFT_475940 [Mollisia scopiformis]|uniref:Uncharacterized protein n=1 Tax=Mollisia scopiformis TaxID=149040 RepID=A0A194XFZ8_MOLSC|nr:uncharacterized protein LY89DRAFT_475940 [Mollisia scopiformis]KUJ19066.1 hypothetical protein LY89DRAFT_475940 [Mollisia scopiformis]
MSASPGPDPRLEGRTSTYNRDEVVRLITEFYQFLACMPFIEPEDIQYPAPSGWPNITPERFAALDKTDAVIDLLAHLPYIRNHSFGLGRGMYSTCIWFQTCALNYAEDPFKTSPLDLEKIEYLKLPVPDSEPVVVPPHVAVWTEQEVPLVGHIFMIDTMDGTITEYPDWRDCGWAQYPQHDPRSWRNEYDKTMLLSEFLDEMKQGYLELRWIPYWFRKVPKVYVRGGARNDRGNGDEEELYKIMIAHGWPDEFRRDECKAALLAWRTQNEGE